MIRLSGFPGFVCYEIGKEAVTWCKLGDFESFFDIERIRLSGMLGSLRGRVTFKLSGFEHDSRNDDAIPEIRTFIRQLVPRWPYFFFADSLQNCFLEVVVQCLLNNSVTLDRGNSNIVTAFDPAELDLVCKPLFKSMIDLNVKIDGLSDSEIQKHVLAVWSHLTKRVTDPPPA